VVKDLFQIKRFNGRQAHEGKADMFGPVRQREKRRGGTYKAPEPLALMRPLILCSDPVQDCLWTDESDGKGPENALETTDKQLGGG